MLVAHCGRHNRQRAARRDYAAAGAAAFWFLSCCSYLDLSQSSCIDPFYGDGRCRSSSPHARACDQFGDTQFQWGLRTILAVYINICLVSVRARTAQHKTTSTSLVSTTSSYIVKANIYIYIIGLLREQFLKQSVLSLMQHAGNTPQRTQLRIFYHYLFVVRVHTWTAAPSTTASRARERRGRRERERGERAEREENANGQYLYYYYC